MICYFCRIDFVFYKHYDMSVINFFKTTLFRKIIMSFTGLFIAFFLIIHLAGNLQLLLPYDRAHEQYNSYSHLLSHNILIEVIAFILYFSFLIHIFNSIVITYENYKSSGISYKKDTRGINSSWFSRNMGILGVIILLFLIIHLRDYWYLYKFKTDSLPIDSKGKKDIFLIVYESFKVWWIVLIYVVAFISLAFHLSHGIWSAFRTLGVYNKWYIKASKFLSIGFAIILCAGYAAIPIIIYIQNL